MTNLNPALLVALSISLATMTAYTNSAEAKGSSSVIDRSVAALKTGNVKAYKGTVVNSKRLKKVCPAMVKKMGSKRTKTMLKRLAKSVDTQVKACAKAFDWSAAKEVSRENGAPIDSSKSRCAKGAESLSSASVLFKVGDQGWKVTLGRSMQLRGKRYFAAPPKCEKAALPR